MGDTVNLTTIKSSAGNKKLIPDSSGYYKVILGAFNVKNSSGQAYSSKGVKELLADKTNLFNTRLAASRLRAEAEHPEFVPGMSRHDFFSRNLAIKVSRACAHIKEVSFRQTKHSEGIPGLGNVVIIEGLVKPSGQFAPGLKDSLDNPEEDTCFSIRSFTMDKTTGLLTTKFIKQIITWDWVSDPGIKYASKLNSPSVESADLQQLTVEDIATYAMAASNPNSALSTEDAEVNKAVVELLSNCDKTDVASAWANL